MGDSAPAEDFSCVVSDARVRWLFLDVHTVLSGLVGSAILEPIPSKGDYGHEYKYNSTNAPQSLYVIVILMLEQGKDEELFYMEQSSN